MSTLASLAATGEPTGANVLTASLTRYASLDDDLLAQWSDLGRRLHEENIYLSPDFVRPAIDHLAGGEDVLVMTVRDPLRPDVLLGLGLFQESRDARRYPFSVLRAYKSPHSFLTGFLLDEDRYADVVAAVRTFMRANRRRWTAMEFEDLEWDGAFSRLMREGSRPRPHWFEYEITQRASLDLRGAPDPAAIIDFGRKTMKNLRRARRGLEEAGSVSWRIVCGDSITDEVLETFLRLEHAGWKGEAGTSLNSKSGDRRFFLAMLEGLRHDNAFFTELLLDGQVIASTCNLYTNSTGFAFKGAWDPAHSRYSPGLLNECEFLITRTALHDRLDHLDSGASAGSFIDRLWPDRKAMASGLFVFSPHAIWYARTLEALRSLKRVATRPDAEKS